jgi:osmotically inducible lipoprotein OsmB
MKCFQMIFTTLLLGSILLLSSCTKKEKTIAGAAIGAGTGALVGSAAGGTGGAIAGGAIGGITGGLIGNSLGDDKKK